MSLDETAETMTSKMQARQNIKRDFDKDAAVDLLCGRIDELEGALDELLRRIYLQRANTDLPWLLTWETICEDALRIQRSPTSRTPGDDDG